MNKRICSVPECGRVHYGKGFCSMHYQRLRSTGDVQPEKGARVSYDPDAVCAADGCDLPVKARFRCRKHFEALLRQEADGYQARTDHWSRFWSKVVEVENCWIWQGDFDGHGYGKHRVEGRSVSAHRYAYEGLVAEIPSGLVIDHLCRRPKCVNPFHMEPVTVAENTRRGLAAQIQTHCNRGHPFTPENTFAHSRGSRECRTCRKARARQRQERKRRAA